jgi:hypothetical protein
MDVDDVVTLSLPARRTTLAGESNGDVIIYLSYGSTSLSADRQAHHDMKNIFIQF